ncbi:MAG TPA: DUF2490 domain-containing protein [Prolixibacteraceae bacterium]|nr:DUF2490 domain-containing protein [Prolixibacteraceae bacterium]
MRNNKVILSLLSLLLTISAIAQNGPSPWVELEFSKKIVKNLKVEFNPELRFFNDFKIDTYILEGGLSYKLHDYLTVAGYYRYENTNDYKPNREVFVWEPSNRFAFDAKTGIDIQRFNVSFRLRYTNGAEINNPDEDRYSFFRYRTKIDYDIKGSKIIPYVSAEAFHDLKLNYFDKMRYTGGIAYPLNKDNELSLFYRLQDYLEDPEIDESLHENKESMHIIGIGYSLKF